MMAQEVGVPGWLKTLDSSQKTGYSHTFQVRILACAIPLEDNNA
jgi:hypothetical protein